MSFIGKTTGRIAALMLLQQVYFASTEARLLQGSPREWARSMQTSDSCYVNLPFPHIFGSEADASGGSPPSGDSRIDSFDYSPKEGGFIVYAGVTQDRNFEQSDYTFVARIDLQGNYVFANHLHTKYNQVQIVKIMEEDTIFMMARQQANREFISMIVLNADGTKITNVSDKFIKFSPWSTDISNPLGIVFAPYDPASTQRFAFITTYNSELPSIGVQKIDLWSEGDPTGLAWDVSSASDEVTQPTQTGGYALSASFASNQLFLGGSWNTQQAVIQTLSMDDGALGWQVSLGAGSSPSIVTGLQYYNNGSTGFLFATTLFQNRLEFARFRLTANDGVPEQQLRTETRYLSVRGLYVENSGILWALGIENTNNEAYLYTINFATGVTTENALLISSGPLHNMQDVVFTGPGVGFFGGFTAGLQAYKQCIDDFVDLFAQTGGFKIGYIMTIEAQESCVQNYAAPSQYNNVVTGGEGEFTSSSLAFYKDRSGGRTLEMSGADQISSYGILSPFSQRIQTGWCTVPDPQTDKFLVPTNFPDEVWSQDEAYFLDFPGFQVGGVSTCSLGEITYIFTVSDLQGNELADGQHPFTFDGVSISADPIPSGTVASSYVLKIEARLGFDECEFDEWLVEGLDCTDSVVTITPYLFTDPVEYKTDDGVKSLSLDWSLNKPACGVSFDLYVDGVLTVPNSGSLISQFDNFTNPLVISIDTFYLLQSHQIEVVAARYGVQSGSYSFTLNALDPCIDSDVQFDFSAFNDPFILQLDYPVQTLTIGFTTSVEGCQPTFQVLQDLTENLTLVTDVRILSNSLELDVEALSPQQENDYLITLVATLSPNQNQFVDEFTITVENRCKTLTPSQLPAFVNQVQNVAFFDTSAVDAIKLEIDEAIPLDCGVYTYSYIDAVDCSQNPCQSINDLALNTDYSFVNIDDPSSIFTLVDPVQHPGPFEVLIQVDMGGYQTFTSTQSTTIIPVNPCESTQIDGQTINDISTTVKSFVDGETSFGVFTDSVSCQLGSQDCITLCGEGQTYSIEVVGQASLPSWISFDPNLRLISAAPTADNDVGVYEVRVTVSHTKYSQLQQYSSFHIFISECQVQDLSAPALDTFTYTVDESAKSYIVPMLTQAPNCGYDLTYEPIIPVQLAPYVQYDHLSRTLIFQTDDNSLDGSWTIGFKVSDNVSSVPVELDIQVPLTIANSCSDDFATSVSVVSDFQYLIGIDGQVLKKPTARVNKRNCPVTLTFEQTVAPVPFSSADQFDPRIVASYSVAQDVNDSREWSADIVFEVTDFSVDTENVEPYPEFTWTVCTDGTQVDACTTMVWTVNTVDNCWLQTLTAASWINNNNQIEVRAQAVDTVSIQLATASTVDCGQVSHELLYADGSPVDPNLFQLNGDIITISPDSTEEGNFYELIIRSQLGTYGKVTVDSTVLSVTIGPNICYSAQIVSNSQSIFNGYLQTSVLAGQQDQLREPHIDDTGLCGDIVYNLYEIVATTRQAAPSFITHVNEDVTVEATLNSHIGTYNMVLVVSLVDYPSVTLDEPFTVDVIPCQIISFTKSPENLSFSYIVGEPIESTSYPVYSLTPSCDYTPTYSLDTQDGSSLSDIFTPNTLGFDTFAADGNELQGTYPLVVSVSFNFDGVEYLADQTQFEVKVSPDCNDATIKENPEKVFGSGLIQTTVKADPLQDQRAAYTSSEGICGSISYRLVGNPGFVTHIDQNVRVEPTLDSQVGTYQVTMEVYLTDYPSVILQEAFTVEVGYCLPSLNKVGNIQDFTYTIGDQEYVVAYPTFVQTPACGYDAQYELQKQDQSTLESAFVDNGSQLTVFTAERTEAGIFPLVLSVTFSFDNTLLASDSSTEFVVTLKDPCEDVTIPETFSQQVFLTYFVDSPQALSSEKIDPGFESSLAGIGCQLEFSMTQTQYDQGQYDASIFSEVSSGVYQVQTSQLSLDQTTIVLTIDALAPISGATAQSTINVAFVDLCRVTDLNNARWNFATIGGNNAISSYTYEFSIQALNSGEIPEIDFFPATDSLNRCGTIHYRLSNNDYLVDWDSSGKVTYPGLTSQANSIYTDKIEFFNNFVEGESPNTLTLSIIDECEHASWTNEISLDEIQATVLGGEVTSSFVSNYSLESQYGDVCSTTYTVKQSNGVTFAESWLTFDVETLTFTVDSTQTSEEGLYELQLERKIDANGESVELIPLNIRIGACEISQINVSNGISNFAYTTGDIAQTRSFSFSQVPNCGYQLDYSATIVENNGRESPVTGEPFDLSGSNLVVSSTDNSLAGQYTLKIYANYGSQERFFLVNVEVIEQQQIITSVNNAPFFPGLQGDTVHTFMAGESFNLFVGSPIDIDEGETDNLKISVKLGNAGRFMSWFQRDYEFSVRGGKTDESDAGLYYVTVTVEDQRGGKSTQNVIFEILAPEIEEEDPPLLQGPVSSGIIEEDEEPEPLVPVQAAASLEPTEFTEGPQALITGLSNTGKMTVRFTQPMVVPKDWEKIHDQSVAINVDDSFRRRLSTVVQKPKVEISMLPSPDSDVNDLGLDWRIINFTEDQMEIQVLFDDPERISHTIDNDQIRIAFWDSSSFRTQSGEVFPSGVSTKKNAVRQIEPSTESERLEQATIAIKMTCLVVIFFTALFFMYAGINDNAYLWSFVMSGQFMFHLPLINVDMPGNAAYFCNILMSLSRLEFLDNKWVTELFNLDLSPTPLESFEQAGYASTHSVENMATVLVIIALLIVLWIACALFRTCKTEYTNQISQVLTKYTFWLITMRVFLLIFIIVAVSSFHNLRFVRADFSSLVSIFSLVILAVFTISITQTWFKSNGKSSEEVADNHGWLAEIMYLKQGDNKAFLFMVLFVWRRMIFASTAAFMPQFFAGQVFCFLFFSMLMCTIIYKYTPFAENRLNWIALINELFLFICGLSLLPMSNLVRTKVERWQLGYFFIGVIITFLVWNLLMIICIGIDAFGKFVKRRSYHEPVVRAQPPKVNVIKDSFYRKSGHLNISRLKNANQHADSYQELALGDSKRLSPNGPSPNQSQMTSDNASKVVENIIDADEIDYYNKRNPATKRKDSFEGVIWDEKLRKPKEQRIEVEDLSVIAEIPNMEKTYSNIRRKGTNKDSQQYGTTISSNYSQKQSQSTNEQDYSTSKISMAPLTTLKNVDQSVEDQSTPPTDSIDGNMLNDSSQMRVNFTESNPASEESVMPEAVQVIQKERDESESAIGIDLSSFESSMNSSFAGGAPNQSRQQNIAASQLLIDTSESSSEINSKVQLESREISEYSMNLPQVSMAKRVQDNSEELKQVSFDESSQDGTNISALMNSKMASAQEKVNWSAKQGPPVESSKKTFSRKDLKGRPAPSITSSSLVASDQDYDSQFTQL